MIENLAATSDLKDYLPLSYSERMRTEELILRYYAVAHDFKNYDQPVSNFLNEYLKKAQQFDEETIKEFKNEFQVILKQALGIFGEKSFKTMFTEDGKKDRFNVSMFDAQMIAVKKLSGKRGTITGKVREKIFGMMRELFQKEEFVSKVTKATSNKSAVKYRVEAVYKVLSTLE
jgi:esterase/lipase